LNELNKRNWVVNHSHLTDGDYLEMSQWNANRKKIAGKQNQSCRSFIKTLLPKEQT